MTISHDREDQDVDAFIAANIARTAAAITAAEKRIMSDNDQERTIEGYYHMCLYCGHGWPSFNRRPKICPACKAVRWNLGRISPHYPKPKRP